MFVLYQLFMHNLLRKMSRYYHILYSLKEKSTHFGLEVSVIYVVLAHFETKNHKKFIKIYQTISKVNEEI